jgi:hypothetical protein
MPIVVEVPNRGSIEFADGTSDADIDAIVAKEFPPTQEDSYQKVLGYEQGASDETPSKDEYLAYLQAKKTKPLLGERPMATLGEAALETGKMLATLPYRAGEAISETAIMPPEGVTRGQAIVGTAAEVAARSETGARKLLGGLQETILSEIDSLAERYGQTLRSDDDKYQAFLGLADVKRKLAKAQMGEQPAAQEFLQAYNIPQEALSPAGLEVGGFVAAPENIAFAGGGKLAGQLLGGTARALPAISGAAQRTGARIGTAARVPEVQAGRAVTAITGSEAAGQAVERAIGTGTTGVAAAEALGLPVAGNIPIPGAGMAASAIGTAKAVGAGLETLGEAGAISGGEALSPIQRGLLGFGERIAAQEGASRTARAFGNVLARTGADVIVPKTASILVPSLGAGAAGGLLAGLTGEEGDQIAAAIGSGFAFGGIESGIRMAAAKGVFDANRVRSTATEDLNTRPNDVQFTYIEPTTKAEQTVTLKDRDARAQLYEQLDDKQLVKALSEIANAENAGVDVVFHKDGDPVPQGLQQIKYKGVALSPDSVKSGRPTILVNVDKASPETIPHEILHARITADMVNRIGSQIIEGSIDPAQFKSFANKYADTVARAGDQLQADSIRNDLVTAFDNNLQRGQRIDALRRMSDEFAAYYTQEFLAGKDPKTVLPGRLPSFFEAAFNSAKEAVSDKFTQKALQSGFDPIAKTFYGPDGKRIKIPWMDDAIKQLIIERKGFEPSEQKLDMRKLTPNQQAALVMSRGFEDLYILNPDGSIGRPKTGQELKLQDIDIAQRSIKLLDSLPAADRGTVTGLDAKGNTIIEGRLSLAEADALARSGIYSASTSRYLGDIARAIVDGSLLNGSYWKVYGRSGRPGVFGESQKLFLPYGIRLNSAGGVIVKVVDFGKVQARMDAALQKQAYKNLFRSYDQAMSTLRDVYLKNLADPNGKPSAEALGGGVEGARKRNFFNEVMGAVPKKGDVMINEPTAGYTASRKGGSVYEDLRIERVQNVEQTGMKIPWSGDMGEQSSYRRTQLNFQPAETIGDKSVESDANAGFRILSSRGKFRLYSPDGDLLGIYDSAGQAKLKAEKTYATQTRLQPENDQLQYPTRNEVGQTAEAGNRNRALDRTQGREEGGQALGQVRQEGDVGARFMPSDVEYLSAVEAGDTSKTQELVDQAAKAAGYTVGPVFHGSAARFNQFKRTFFGTATGGQSANEAFFFSTSDKTAKNYASYASEEGPIKELMRKAEIAEAKGNWDLYEKLLTQAEELDFGPNAQQLREQRRQQSKVYDVYLKGRFLEMDAEGKTPAELSSAKAFKQFDGSLTAALKSAKRKGYDGVLFKNLDDAPNLSDPSDHYAIFDPNKIKLADPITRDDAGDIIPLSQRFQQSSADIRYMPAPVPDPSIPGAYSMNGYRILPGKTKGKLRVYSPSGALVGVVGSVDDAQRMIQRKLR